MKPELGGQDPIIDNPSVNGDVRTYVLHVGAEADLGVGVTVEPADSADTSLDPGDNVTITGNRQQRRAGHGD